MPCQRLFDQQSEGYKNKILNETKLVVSIEASETNYWKKYTGSRGLNFGINDFGKSFKSMTLDTVKGFLNDSKKSKFTL